MDNEPTDRATVWERRIEKHGWPATFLLLIVFVGGYIAWRASDWLVPKIDQACNVHFQFVDEIAKIQHKQAENNERLIEQTVKLNSIADRQEKRIEEIHRRVVRENLRYISPAPAGSSPDQE